MTLLHIDGFEGYGKEDVLSFWASGSYIDTSSLIDQTGRRNGYCLNAPDRTSTSDWRLRWSNTNPIDEQVMIVGCAFRMGANLGNVTVSFLTIKNPMGSTIANVGINTDYTISVSYSPSNTNQILYISEILDQNVWYYLELKGKMSSPGGIVVCRLNEQIIYENYNLDTVAYQASGTQIGSVQFYISSYNRIAIDDIYILDTTGTKNNDFLGDIRVDSIHPDGAGNYTQLTPSAGNNYECVDETNMDSADYVEGANAGEKDSYSYGSVPTDLDDAAIFGTQLRNQAVRTAESDNIKVKGFLRTGSTDYEESTAQSLSTIYKSKSIIWEDDPSDSNVWTKAKINACEFGVEVA